MHHAGEVNQEITRIVLLLTECLVAHAKVRKSIK